MIYLDYTANMPPEPAALARFCEVEQACLGNPNAKHTAGRQAQAVMAAAIDQTAELLGVQPEELIFTSGASESNNTALQGLAWAGRQFGRRIVTTPLEHPSVSGCLTALQERGWQIDLVRLGPDGRVDLAHLRELLRPDTVLAAVCAVDSELGVIQPVAEIAELLRPFPRCRLHVDATQAIGRIPFEFSLADTVSLSAHKFGGFNGSGLLYKRQGTPMEPLIYGGVSATLYRSGTPAVGLMASLATALEIALRERESRFDRVAQLNAQLRQALLQRGVRLHSPQTAVPHILNVGVAGVGGAAFRDALDRQGVCVSVKSACSVENTASQAVYAVTRDRRKALESWRISLSHLTAPQELEVFLRAFDTVYKELKA